MNAWAGVLEQFGEKKVIPFKRGKKEGNKRRMAQSPDEKTYVEIPFIEQLKRMGWDHIEGDIDVPYLTERETLGIEEKQLTVREDPRIKKIDKRTYHESTN